MSCGKLSTDLQSKGFYMIRVFARRYFWTDYNIVLFPKVAIKKCPSIIIPVHSCWDCRLSACTFSWECAPLRVFLWFLFAFILPEHPSMIVSPVCIFKIYQRRKSFILVASIRFYTLFTKLKLLCICLAVS